MGGAGFYVCVRCGIMLRSVVAVIIVICTSWYHGIIGMWYLRPGCVRQPDASVVACASASTLFYQISQANFYLLSLNIGDSFTILYAKNYYYWSRFVGHVWEYHRGPVFRPGDGSPTAMNVVVSTCYQIVRSLSICHFSTRSLWKFSHILMIIFCIMTPWQYFDLRPN